MQKNINYLKWQRLFPTMVQKGYLATDDRNKILFAVFINKYTSETRFKNFPYFKQYFLTVK